MLGTLSEPRRGQMSHICDISALRVNNNHYYGSIIWFVYLLTVPSVDSIIPITIEPVVTGNMVSVPLLANVSSKADDRFNFS